MKLLRKINNNAAVAQDNRGREMVVLGRGVGFHSMPYELPDLSVVYRTFYDEDPQYTRSLPAFRKKRFWQRQISPSRPRSPCIPS